MRNCHLALREIIDFHGKHEGFNGFVAGTVPCFFPGNLGFHGEVLNRSLLRIEMRNTMDTVPIAHSSFAPSEPPSSTMKYVPGMYRVLCIISYLVWSLVNQVGLFCPVKGGISMCIQTGFDKHVHHRPSTTNGIATFTGLSQGKPTRKH